MKFANRTNGVYYITCKKCGGGEKTSVTTHLSSISKPALYYWHFKMGHEMTRADSVKDMKTLWSDFNVNKTKRMDKGSDVHNYLEAYFKKSTYMPPLLGSPYLKAVEMFLAKEGHNFEVIFPEHQLHSCSLSVAGTCDLITLYKGKTYVVDWKTNDAARLFPDVGLQLGAYAHMAEEMSLVKKVEGRMAVAFGLDGKYTMQEFDDCFDTFLSVKHLYDWLHKSESK